MRLHGHRTAQLLRLVKHDQLRPREVQYHPPVPPHPCCLPTHSLAPSVLPQRLNLGCNSLSEDLRLRPMHSSRLHLSSQGLDQSFPGQTYPPPPFSLTIISTNDLVRSLPIVTSFATGYAICLHFGGHPPVATSIFFPFYLRSSHALIGVTLMHDKDRWVTGVLHLMFLGWFSMRIPTWSAMHYG